MGVALARQCDRVQDFIPAWGDWPVTHDMTPHVHAVSRRSH